MSSKTQKKLLYYRIIILLILAICASIILVNKWANAAQLADKPGSDYVVAQVYYGTQAYLKQMAIYLDIWEIHQAEGYLIARLSPTQYSQLKHSGLRVFIDLEKTELLNQSLIDQSIFTLESIPDFPCYRTVEETYATLTSLEDTYPQLVELIDVGDSWEKVTPGELAGYDIFVLRVTNEKYGEIDQKPTFFLMAEIHAREYVTAETTTRFVEHLLSEYNTNADITWLLDHYRLYILAMDNPDGRKLAEAGYYWRKNTNITNGCINDWEGGTDLNRNHSFHWGGASNNPCDETYQGPEPASEPETQALQNFILSLFPDQRADDDTAIAPIDATGLLISLHSYGQLVLWPWGWTDIDAPNHSQLQTLGRRLAYFNNYTPQQASELYPTTGTTDDWAYGELGIAAFTMEMGTSFFQDCASFESTIYPDNLQVLLTAFKATRQPYKDPSGPLVYDLILSQDTVDRGNIISLNAKADDRFFIETTGQEPTQTIANARYSIDQPSWVLDTITYSLVASDGIFSSEFESLSVEIDTTNLSAGKHIIFVEAMDNDGNWGVPTAIFLYINYLTQIILPLVYK